MLHTLQEKMMYSEAVGMCVVLMLVLFILNFKNWKFKKINNLSCLYIFLALEAVNDIVWYWIDGYEAYYVANRIMQCVYQIIFPFIGWLWLCFTIERGKFKVAGTRWFRLLLLLPCFGIWIISILSVNNKGFLFWIGPDNDYVYTRGPLNFLGTIVQFSYLIGASFVSLLSAAKAKLISEKRNYVWNSFFIIPSLLLSCITLFSEPGIPTTYFGVVISLLLLYVNSLNDQITKDSLTSLNNRMTIDRKLQDAIRRQERGTESSLWLIALDLNDFKKINDSFGHGVGDQALIVASQAMTDVALSARAEVGRIGGDEFIMIVEARDPNGVRSIVTELPRVMKEYSKDAPYKLSVSIGVALFEKGMNKEELLEHADRRLYSVKRSVLNHKK